MTRFSDRMLPGVVQTFWAALQRGEFITDAAAQAGTYRKKGTRWVAAAGGFGPRRGRDLQGRYLSFAEREEIALAGARGESMRQIAARLGRSPSTISRELGRNSPLVGGPPGYGRPPILLAVKQRPVSPACRGLPRMPWSHRRSGRSWSGCSRESVDAVLVLAAGLALRRGGPGCRRGVGSGPGVGGGGRALR
ncbi:helix-turn-helix domain-containing protein [Amycolatopsis arida]|uniref:helix-turn-helix domain-containing protein n=1 Tax=Amycolatopsis arida TaxID=587909 RepID=UPI001AB060AC